VDKYDCRQGPPIPYLREFNARIPTLPNITNFYRVSQLSSWSVAISEIPTMTSLSRLSLLLSIFFCHVLSASVIPHPNGTYSVALHTAKLTDKNRQHPYNKSQHRSVMLSAFFPAGLLASCTPKVVQYMPSATSQIQDSVYAPYGIPTGTFESLHLSICKTPRHTRSHPLILFSPGLGNSRLLYSTLAQSIASHGYTVVTIDHPYDASVVEYPDGTLTLGADIETDAQIQQALDVRVQDVHFVLDALSTLAGVRRLIPSAKTPLNNTHALIAGHSLGGATAAQAMLTEPRLVGGVNLDGTFFGSVLETGLQRPFLLFGHEGKNQSTDASWASMWNGLRGWRKELELTGSTHATFTDLPVLVDVLGFRAVVQGVDTVVGVIAGERARTVISVFVAAFAGFVRGMGGEGLLDGVGGSYPEVSVVA
jgi:pimeloyl-ACP methyl ester carboxylesterase